MAARKRRAEPGDAPAPAGLRVLPATPERWPDVEELFGQNGACGGCWCRFWKQDGPEYRAGKGEPNRRALRRSVTGGEVPGLLAYAGEVPVGWAAVEPRARYARLVRSRNLVAVDDAPVWSVPCFFVRRGWRGKGVARALLAGAAEHARRAGAPILEGYPIDSRKALANAFLYTGALSTFLRAGFTEVARKARTRPVVRLALGRARAGRRARAGTGSSPRAAAPSGAPPRRRGR
jgi:GNAT superfamily N-acetyltransferase